MANFNQESAFVALVVRENVHLHGYAERGKSGLELHLPNLQNLDRCLQILQRRYFPDRKCTVQWRQPEASQVVRIRFRPTTVVGVCTVRVGNSNPTCPKKQVYQVEFPVDTTTYDSKILPALSVIETCYNEGNEGVIEDMLNHQAAQRVEKPVYIDGSQLFSKIEDEPGFVRDFVSRMPPLTSTSPARHLRFLWMWFTEKRLVDKVGWLPEEQFRDGEDSDALRQQAINLKAFYKAGLLEQKRDCGPLLIRPTAKVYRNFLPSISALDVLVIVRLFGAESVWLGSDNPVHPFAADHRLPAEELDADGFGPEILASYRRIKELGLVLQDSKGVLHLLAEKSAVLHETGSATNGCLVGFAGSSNEDRPEARLANRFPSAFGSLLALLDRKAELEAIAEHVKNKRNELEEQLKLTQAKEKEIHGELRGIQKNIPH
jgi:hypothetical protein